MLGNAPACKYVLGYWNTRALAEPVRLLLAFCCVEWEDKRYQVGPPVEYDKSCWSSEKESLGLPYPNLPYLIETNSGLKITQTRAILRFLARRHDLAGKTEVEQTRADVICEGLFESWDTMFKTTYCDHPGVDVHADTSCHVAGEDQCTGPEKRFLMLKKAYVTNTLPQSLARVSSAMSALSWTGQSADADDSTNVWVAGPNLTYTDFALFEFIDTHLLLDPNCLDAFPRLSLFYQKFSQLPQIAAYRSSERFKAGVKSAASLYLYHLVSRY